MKPNVFSIYSGAGGIDSGFKKAGFNIVYSTDNWLPACETLKKNHTATLVECEDIRKIDFKDVAKRLGIKKVDVLTGGPPCPPYSKSRFYLKSKKRALEDENSYTLAEYFRAVKELNPKVFLFENVYGFVYKPHQAAFDYLKKEGDRLGYNLTFKVINTANFGIPQTRERFICIGVKRSIGTFNFPNETHSNPNKKTLLKPWVTSKEAIGDLDYAMPDDEKMKAGSKDYQLLKKVPPGDNYLYFTKERRYPKPIFKWRSRYWSFLLKLSPNRPSWTIQASHSNNMGPFHWKNRFLRIGEIKRIQTFDDNYFLSGDYKTKWRLVGNAVPPLLSKILALSIKQQFFNNLAS